MVGSGLMDDATIHALNDKPAKRKIMLWASGARPPSDKLIHYVLYDRNRLYAARTDVAGVLP